MKRNATPSRPVHKGLSLVELLTVVLCTILVISLAIPLYFSATTRKSVSNCSAGLSASANAVCSYGMASVATHRQLARK